MLRVCLDRRLIRAFVMVCDNNEGTNNSWHNINKLAQFQGESLGKEE